MTGFGRSSAEVGGFTATVEIRSVNGRFCEVVTRLPRSLSDREGDVQQRMKQAFARGRINVQVQVERVQAAALIPQVDVDAAQAYGRLLETLRQAAGIEVPVCLEDLLRFQEVLKPVEETAEASEQAWQAVEQALNEAINLMQAMRRQEGRVLRDELVSRIDNIEVKLDAVEVLASERIPQVHTRLQERLEELLQDARINPERIEVELAILADKLDVTEECVRLRSHLAVFRETLESAEPVGRKLNFLSQEFNREINTVGSKANDATITHLVVSMKEELEKIREQVENIQ